MTVSALTIRPYRGPEDMPHLAAIFNASAEAEGLHDRRSVEQLAAWYAVPSARLDPTRDILLAELDGRPVGYGRHSWVDTTDGLRAVAEADGLHDRRSVEQMAAWYTRTTHLDPPRDILIAEEDGRAVGYGRHSWVDTTDGLREHRLFVFALPDRRGAIEP